MAKKTRFKSLKEAIFGIPDPAETREGRLVLGKVKQSYGVRLPTNFFTQVQIYNSDPCLKESIKQMAQECVCGGGFFVTMDDEYKLSLPRPEGEGEWTAREALNYFNETNNVDGALLTIAIELISFGNSFWYIKDGLKHIPIEAIKQARPKKKTVPISAEYDLYTTARYGNKKIQWGEFLHFSINTTGYEPFGTGTILGLIARPHGDSETPSLWDIRKSVRRSMKIGFEKFSFGNELWYFEGMSDDRIETVDDEIKNMKSTGKRIVSNVKGDIRLAVPQRTQSYDKWIEQIDKEFYLALASGMTPNTEYTTKATAEAVREIYKMRIASLRRAIKRVVEKFWKDILTTYGFDAIKAKSRLHFGSDEVEYKIEDIFRAVETNIISKEEARILLREYSKWKLEGKAPKDEKPEEKKPEDEKNEG